ncbi:MAG: redoxin domain-containing protein [Bacteroidota bacterium]
MKFFQKLFLPLVTFFLTFSGVQAQQSLPQFSFSDLDGKAFTYAQLRSDIPTIVFFFDPYCEHCQQQATWMKEAKNELTNVQQIWVTTEEPIAARDFGEKYLGGDWDNVHILIDKQFLFDGYFGYSQIPSIYLYNNQGQQVKAFDKETPADVLLRFL